MKIKLSILFSFILFYSLQGQNTWSKSFEILPSNDQTWDIVIKQDKLYLQVVGYCADGSTCSSLIEMNTNGEVLNNYNLEKSDYLFDLHNSMLIENNRILNLGTSKIVDTVYNGTISSFDLNTKEFIHKKLTNKKGLFAPTNIERWKGTNKYLVVGQFQTKPFEAENAWCGITLLDSTLNIIEDTILNTDFYNLIPADMYQDSDTSFVYFVNGCKIGKCSNVDGSKLYSYRINEKIEIIDSTLIDKALDFSEASKTWPYIEPSIENKYVLTWRDNLAPMVNYYEPYICKLDNKGNQIWKTKFKLDYKYSFDKSINNVITLKNGDYLLIGSDHLSPIKSLDLNAGWAARINTNGEIIWEKNYYNKVPLNFPLRPILELFDGVEGDDGSIYMCGTLLDSIDGISPPQVNGNNWVIKVGPDGCLTPGCTDSLIYVTTTEIKNLKQDLLQIVPTLANQNVTVIWKDAFTDANHIIIRNIEGSLLKDLIVQGKAGQANIDIKNLPSGMYITTIQGKGWQSMPVKFVKQ